MVDVKFIIKTENIRDPILTIKLIKEHIELICGECYIESETGYLKKVFGVDDNEQ